MSRRLITFVVLVAGVTAAMALAGFASADDGGRPLSTTLTGAEEVGGGDPEGFGEARLRLNPGLEEICFELTVGGIQLPAGSAGVHIHEAPAGQDGPVVVPLLPAGEPTDPVESGCVTASRELILEIMMNPEDYYVNVHTAEFPAGAIRGQLGD